ncbi:MAG: sulfite exporter TauE/SafE family protein [Candidatus Coatesbacteria bacterium]|nr:sulfite exporter TauE/SafE family protein [Candidatus Coatesbacteria bacterium]
MEISILAPIVAFVISFVFPMLGMGGSQVMVPALLWMGMDFKLEVIPLALTLNLISTLSGTLTYAKARLIDWRAAIPFAAGALIFAPLGAWANVGLSKRVLVIIFVILTIKGIILMVVGWRPKAVSNSHGARIAVGAGGGGLLGFICGLVGRGGGALAVPFLYATGLNAKRAAATSLFVVMWSTAAALLSHVALSAKPDWSIWLPCMVATLIGSQLGARVMTFKMNPRIVRLSFAIVLGMVTVILILTDIIGD